MHNITDFFSTNKFGSLATCDSEKPDARPIELVYSSPDGLYFYTSATEKLTQQLAANPNICFCATDADYNYGKICGSVVFSDKQADKEKILANSKFASQIFNNSNLDKMKVFYLPHGSCMLHTHLTDQVASSTF